MASRATKVKEIDVDEKPAKPVSGGQLKFVKGKPVVLEVGGDEAPDTRVAAKKTFEVRFVDLGRELGNAICDSEDSIENVLKRVGPQCKTPEDIEAVLETAAKVFEERKGCSLAAPRKSEFKSALVVLSKVKDGCYDGEEVEGLSIRKLADLARKAGLSKIGKRAKAAVTPAHVVSKVVQALDAFDGQIIVNRDITKLTNKLADDIIALTDKYADAAAKLLDKAQPKLKKAA